MIYNIGDAVVDLSKLEYVSEIKEEKRNHKMAPQNREGFYFSFLINGTTLYADSEEHKFTTKVIKDNLIKAWKEYKDEK